jgi:hypothetical protein
MYIPQRTYTYLFSLISLFTLNGCGEEDPSSRVNQMMERVSEGELTEEQGDQNEMNSMVEADGTDDHDASHEGYWATKPPILEEEDRSQDDLNSSWIEVDLNIFDLVTPEDGVDEMPMGTSICAYESPQFTLSHPLRDQENDGQRQGRQYIEDAYHLPPAPIAHLGQAIEGSLAQESTKPDLPSVVLPVHVNDLPLYSRAQDWSNERCYQLSSFKPESEETSLEGVMLSESDAFDMYTHLIKTTLWREVNQDTHHRSVIGLRGAYPGSLRWHHNAPNQYNDTIVLLWRDEQGIPHVKEYPVNTDTGVYDFGVDSSSSLSANRHYPYVNGWHRDYHALQMNLPGYPVRDDTNNNGHWDSDRNGWLAGPEPGDDYNRMGSAHNIHAGNVGGLLNEVLVNIASAGCQVIPGMENWISFIGHAWTALGDEVDYYLIDSRDISPRFWAVCEEADGSHRCPHLIETFPYQHQGDTSLSQEKWYDDYNCSEANESGAEVVYVVNLPRAGLLRVVVNAEDENVDPDIYLLDGDDRKACLARDHRVIESWLPEGRYVIMIDTWVDTDGIEKSGEYTLSIDWSPNR